MMNRKSFLSSLGGVAAACALQCFGFVDRVKAVAIGIQQKLVGELVIGANGVRTPPVWVYRMAPSDIKEDDPNFPECATPDDAYRSAGLEPPKSIFNFTKVGDPINWNKIS